MTRALTKLLPVVLLMLPVAAIGGLGPDAERSDAPAAVLVPGGTFEVMTLNTWGLPSPIAKDRKGRFPRIAEFVRAQGVDLAGLQEVWKGAARLLLDLDGLFMPPRHRGDTGLALVTPHPIEYTRVVIFRESRGVDRLKEKGVLQARLRLPDQEVMHVFVTHMQAGGGEKNARVRETQAAQLLSLVADVQGPAVVLGDFNLYARNPIDEATWGRLHEAGLVDAAVSVGREEPTYLGSSHRFDHVYVRSGAGMQLTPDHAEVVQYDEDPATANPTKLSDHLPLRVRLKLSRAQAAQLP